MFQCQIHSKVEHVLCYSLSYILLFHSEDAFKTVMQPEARTTKTIFKIKVKCNNITPTFCF